MNNKDIYNPMLFTKHKKIPKTLPILKEGNITQNLLT